MNESLIKAGEELRQVFAEAGERMARLLAEANRGIAEAMRSPKDGNTGE